MTRAAATRRFALLAGNGPRDCFDSINHRSHVSAAISVAERDAFFWCCVILSHGRSVACLVDCAVMGGETKPTASSLSLFRDRRHKPQFHYARPIADTHPLPLWHPQAC